MRFMGNYQPGLLVVADAGFVFEAGKISMQNIRRSVTGIIRPMNSADAIAIYTGVDPDLIHNYITYMQDTRTYHLLGATILELLDVNNSPLAKVTDVFREVAI